MELPAFFLRCPLGLWNCSEWGFGAASLPRLLFLMKLYIPWNWDLFFYVITSCYVMSECHMDGAIPPPPPPPRCICKRKQANKSRHLDYSNEVVKALEEGQQFAKSEQADKSHC